ncbi:hypothetical protein FGF80_14230 [Natrinema pallidum]|uniref:Uncharacterized protein n=1 Tax=Natrinema pallidum TaxID=69527 RepID=A0A4P9THQ9_9EURY|nr:hypothetical protein FGF80_14230 [Natrinema pallidum]
MAMDDFLEGTTLTGRQAAIIFFAFLILIITAAVLLLTFSDFFKNLVAAADSNAGRVGALSLVIVPSASELESRCHRTSSTWWEGPSTVTVPVVAPPTAGTTGHRRSSRP